MKKLTHVQKITVLQIDIDNAEGKNRCPIFQSLKREFGIETKVNFDYITSLFDRACFSAADNRLGQFGTIAVNKEMINFMTHWDKTQSATPTSFQVNAYECQNAESGRRTIMDYYHRHASLRQRKEIETYLGL